MQRAPYLAIRGGFRLAERIAPDLGARWAERLWFRPPRARTHSGAPPGRPFTLDVDGHAVVGQEWGDGPTVYLMHGWGGTAGQLDALVTPLVAAGHRVVGFDAPNHGASEPGAWGPHRSAIPEFTAALRAAVTRHGPAYAVVAHSLGCAAVAIAVRDGLAAKRLVFLAPMANPTPATYVFARRLGFGERVRQRMVRRIETRLGAPMSYFDVPSVAGEVSVPPTLVVHDRGDRETSFSDAEAIVRAWPGSRLRAVSGLGHHRLLRDPATVHQVVTYLTD